MGGGGGGGRRRRRVDHPRDAAAGTGVVLVAFLLLAGVATVVATPRRGARWLRPALLVVVGLLAFATTQHGGGCVLELNRSTCGAAFFFGVAAATAGPFSFVKPAGRKWRRTKKTVVRDHSATAPATVHCAAARAAGGAASRRNHHHLTWLKAAAGGEELRSSRRDNKEEDDENVPRHDHHHLMMMMLQISYDGRAFTGWSAANDPNQRRQQRQGGGGADADDQSPPQPPPVGVTRSPRRRRRRGGNDPELTGVRSVQGEIVKCLTQLYGNRPQVDGVTIVVDSCSRTDKGVHSIHGGMTALAYAYYDSNNHRTRQAEPWELLPLPMPPSRIVYALNRMLPADVRVTNIATVNRQDAKTSSREISNATEDEGYDGLMRPPGSAMTNSSTGKTRPPFKLRDVVTNMRKTYQYQFSTGPYHDPMSRKTCWHVTAAPPNGKNAPSEGSQGPSSIDGNGNNESGDDTVDDDAETTVSEGSALQRLDVEAMQCACRYLTGTHDFRAFQAGPRGSERRNPHTVCTIDSIHLVVQPPNEWDSLKKGGCQYIIEVTGDRFLYKMVRMMVGCVVAVGQGRIDPTQVVHVLEDGHPSRESWPEFQCAPSHGLALVNVQYEMQPGWDVSWL